MLTDDEVKDVIGEELREVHRHRLARTCIVCCKTISRASEFFKGLLVESKYKGI